MGKLRLKLQGGKKGKNSRDDAEEYEYEIGRAHV